MIDHVHTRKHQVFGAKHRLLLKNFTQSISIVLSLPLSSVDILVAWVTVMNVEMVSVDRLGHVP